MNLRGLTLKIPRPRLLAFFWVLGCQAKFPTTADTANLPFEDPGLENSSGFKIADPVNWAQTKSPIPPQVAGNSIALYVAPGGNDSNDGKSRTSPFQTLEKAKATAAQLAHTSGKNVIVYLHGGYYKQLKPLEFGPADGGSDNTTVVFTRDPQDTMAPYILGSLAMNGSECQWQSWPVTSLELNKTVTVQKCDLNKTSIGATLSKYISDSRAAGENANRFALSSLMVNGQTAIRARYPNSDAPVTLMRTNAAQSYFSLELKAPATVTDNVIATIADIVFTNSWLQYRIPLKQLNSSPNTGTIRADLELGGQPGGLIAGGAWVADQWGPTESPGERWHFEGNLNFLDSPGEWHLDEAALQLYYMPRSGENPAAVSFLFPVNSTIFRFVGTSPSEMVKNVTIDGLMFMATAWNYENAWGGKANYSHVQASCGQGGVIEGYNVSGLNIQNSFFAGVGKYGISLSNARTYECGRYDPLNPAYGRLGNVSIAHNVFQDSASGGIFVNVLELPATRLSIINNQISREGQTFADSVGIGVFNVNRAEIKSNTLSSLPYTGITSGWSKRVGSSDFIIIQDNKVSDVLQRLRDGGGIYTNGMQGLIRNNQVTSVGTSRTSDAPSPAKSLYGIYLDDMSMFYYLSGNYSPSLLSKTISNYDDSTNSISATTQSPTTNSFELSAGQAVPYKPLRTFSQLPYDSNLDGGASSTWPNWWNQALLDNSGW